MMSPEELELERKKIAVAQTLSEGTFAFVLMVRAAGIPLKATLETVALAWEIVDKARAQTRGRSTSAI